jgi:hypothetical protein
MAFPAPRQSNKALIAAIVVLLLALLGAVGFMLRNRLVQAPGDSRTGALVQAPGELRGGAPVQAPADSNPNKIVQVPAPVINTAAIDDYLRFVKRIEEQKMALTKQELASALASQAGSLAKQAEAATDDQKSKEYLPTMAHESAATEPAWDNLTKTFAARVPPPECVSLRDAYYAYLGKVEAQFVKLHSAYAEAQSDPGKALNTLTSMQGTASVEADNAARAADDALDDICRKYSLRKEFKIETDPSASTGSLR